MSTFSGFLMEGELSEPKLPEVDVESIVKDEDVQAAYEENFVEAAARVSAEAQINWNNIMEACTITEFACLESTGQEFVYESGKLSAFFEKVKAFFVNLWHKIQAIFKKAAMQFNAMTSNDKEFLSKYKKTIQKAINAGSLKKDDIEVSIYKDYVFFKKNASDLCDEPEKFTIESLKDIADVFDISDNIEGATVEVLKKINNEITSDVISDAVEEGRAELLKNLGYNGSGLSADEFKKELVELLRGSDSKDDVAIKEAAKQAVAFLEKSTTLKKELNNLLNKNKKSIDKAISATTKLANKLDKASSEKGESGELAGVQHSLVVKGIDIMKAGKTIFAAYNSTILQERKNCSKQCKSVCVKLVSSVKHEATTVTSEGSMSLLDGLDLI